MDKIIAVVWPRPENYARFVEVCASEDFPATYVEFVEHALSRLAEHGVNPGLVEKVFVDPDEMLEWCLRHHGKIDSEARALFALFKVRSRHGKGADSIN